MQFAEIQVQLGTPTRTNTKKNQALHPLVMSECVIEPSHIMLDSKKLGGSQAKSRFAH